MSAWGHRKGSGQVLVTPKIIAACEVLERLGCVGASVVAVEMQVTPSSGSHIMRRAVECGLATATGQRWNRVYRIKPGWRCCVDGGVAGSDDLQVWYAGGPRQLALPSTPWQGLGGNGGLLCARGD